MAPASFKLVSLALLSICIYSPVYSAPATIVTIYHSESGSLVRATTAAVTADAIGTDSNIKFHSYSDGSFESVDHSGKYLLMAANGALSLGPPNEPTFKHKFTRSIAGPHHDFFTAVTSSGSTCYIAFDWLGAQLSSPCSPLSGVDTENAKLQLRYQ